MSQLCCSFKTEAGLHCIGTAVGVVVVLIVNQAPLLLPACETHAEDHTLNLIEVIV